jgi:hypothetical protein
VDRAGNARTTSQLADGTPLTLALPMRAGSALDVGRPVRVRVDGSQHGRPTYRRELVGVAEPGFGRVVRLEGRIVDATGNPRPGEPIDVLERVDLPGLEWKYVATVRSAPSGGFVFRAAPGPARILRFRYAGSARSRPAQDEVGFRVRAGVTLAPTRRSLQNGETVVFKGHLLGAPIPSQGKLLALQANTSHGWRTFATPRASGHDGRWTYRYHFTGTAVTSRYAFRVVAPAEAGYPYASGTSPVVRVLVHGYR